MFQLGKILTLSMVATYDTYVVTVNTVCNTLALSNILGTWLQIGLMGVWIARSIDRIWGRHQNTVPKYRRPHSTCL